MLNFNLEYYRAFYSVAQLGSISKAAEALCLSQPAVTRSVQKLEQQLAQPLFTRTGKGMRLTAGGTVLFSHIAAAFAELLAGEQALADRTAYDEGELQIGATETALYHFLLPKIEAYAAQHPRLKIHLTGSATPQILQLLRGGKADFAVAVSPVQDIAGLQLTRVRSFRDVVVATGAFAALRGVPVTPEQLCGYPLVAVEQGTSARSQLDHWFEQQGVFFTPEYSVQTSTLILPFVQHNLAVGVLPELFAAAPLRDGTVFEVALTPPLPARDIVILHRTDTLPSAAAQQFIDFLCTP